MKVIIAFLLLTIAINARSQNSVPANTIDTSISFFGIKPLNLYNYDNRVVPYGSNTPLYVCITYEGGKFKEKEFFKAVENEYLVYEYFKNGDEKAYGNVKVTDEIIGSSYTRVQHLGIDTPNTSLAIDRWLLPAGQVRQVLGVGKRPVAGVYLLRLEGGGVDSRVKVVVM